MFFRSCNPRSLTAGLWLAAAVSGASRLSAQSLVPQDAAETTSAVATTRAATSTLAARSEVSPAGLWHTVDDVTGKPRAEIRIEVSGDRLTGFVVRSLVPGEVGDKLCDRCPGARHNQPLIGMAILSGLARERNNALVWSGGEVLDPDSGKTYKARVELAKDGQSLKLRGYIGMPLMGRTQVWRRAGA
jgi:uncharacterized protein (DUF2147 family)